MNCLPNEINKLILDYLYTCKKEKRYIINKNFLKLHKQKCKKCNSIFILNKNLCNICEKDKIIKCRMIINNLLPR